MAKVIKDFRVNLNNIGAGTNLIPFSIVGDNGSVFSLEIKNAAGNYYNFSTRTFTAGQKGLRNKKITRQVYESSITLPSVSSNDQYNIYVFADASSNTKHVDYNEVRFADGTIDINSCKGSSSILMKKVIYQYLDSNIGISAISPSSTQHSTGNFHGSSYTASTITASRGANIGKTKFTITATLPATKAMKILRQPLDTDIAAFASVAIGDGVAIKGEDIWSGDARSTDTVNGAVSETTLVTMDTAVASKMKVGDRVTGTGIPTGSVVTVFQIISTYVFRASEALESVGDGVTLTFTPAQYRSWSVHSTGSIHELGIGMSILDSNNLIGAASVAPYEDSTSYITETVNPDGTIKETTNKTIHVSIPAIDTLGLKPTIVNGIVTKQLGNFTLNTPISNDLAGQDSVFYAYGPSAIKKIHNSDIRISNLKVSLVKPTTTTREATSANNTVEINDREGIINNVSRVSGIGIDSSVENPLITSGGGADGIGDIIMDAVQTLENGITLTIENTGRVATITGEVEILNLDDTSFNLYLDVERFLSAV